MSESVNERYNDLDAVRAFALLLGVALHGTMSFLEPRIWIVADHSTGVGFDILFYTVHIFRMTTFFVLAGFFARMMIQKKGLGAFVGNRLKRVGIPLVAFWPIALTAIITFAILANMPAPGSAAASAPAAPPPPLTVATFPLTHLWFLYALLLLYAGTAVIKIVTDVLHVGGTLGRMLDKVVGLLTKADLVTFVLAVPVCLTFLADPAWRMWMGILTPDTGLIPNVTAIAGFCTAFGFGYWLHRRADLLDHLKNRWLVYTTAAGVGTWACLHMAGSLADFTPVKGLDHPIYAAVYALNGWSWTFALIGLARAFLRRENPVIRYVADASYWVYLVHIPLVLGLQYALMKLDWPAEIKFAIVLLGTIGVALATYRLFVRYSFIGTILNGRRRRTKADAVTAAEAIA